MDKRQWFQVPRKLENKSHIADVFECYRCDKTVHLPCFSCSKVFKSSTSRLITVRQWGPWKKPAQCPNCFKYSRSQSQLKTQPTIESPFLTMYALWYIFCLSTFLDASLLSFPWVSKFLVALLLRVLRVDVHLTVYSNSYSRTTAYSLCQLPPTTILHCHSYDIRAYAGR